MMTSDHIPSDLNPLPKQHLRLSSYVSVWCLWAVPDSSNSPYRWHKHSLTGFDNKHSKNWKMMLPDMVIRLSLLSDPWKHLTVAFFILLFCRRVPHLLSQNSLSHLTRSSSDKNSFILDLSILPRSFYFKQFFLFRITNGVSFLPSDRTSSFTVLLNFSCPEKYWFWSFCISCTVGQHIKKSCGFICNTRLS